MVSGGRENEFPWSPAGTLSFTSRVVGRARVLAFVSRFQLLLEFMASKEIHVCKIYQRSSKRTNIIKLLFAHSVQRKYCSHSIVTSLRISPLSR